MRITRDPHRADPSGSVRGAGRQSMQDVAAGVVDLGLGMNEGVGVVSQRALQGPRGGETTVTRDRRDRRLQRGEGGIADHFLYVDCVYDRDCTGKG